MAATWNITYGDEVERELPSMLKSGEIDSDSYMMIREWIHQVKNCEGRENHSNTQLQEVSMGKDFEKLVKDLDPVPVTSGRKIRSVRKYLGLTLKELEEITGLSEPKLSAMENNHTKISRKSAELLGAALGLHPTDILYPNGAYAKDKNLLEVEQKAQLIIHSKTVAK